MSDNRIVARLLAREVRELTADEILIVGGGSGMSRDSGSSWSSAKKDTGTTQTQSGAPRGYDDCDADNSGTA